MALETVSPTIFSGGTIFSSLAAGGFRDSGLDALSRGLRVVQDPSPRTDLLQQEIPIRGYSADTPALFYHPNRLSLSNFLLLSSRNTGPLDVSGGISQAAQNAIFLLQEFALIDRLPFLSNPAEAVLNQAPFGPAVIVEMSQEAAAAIADAATPVARLNDFARRPTEATAFGSTYTAVASDASLNSDYYRRVSVAAGNSISLDELVRRSADGAPTHIALSLLSEGGGSPGGEIQDGLGASVADNTVIAYADLADYSYVAPLNPNGDYLSFIELSDPDSNSIYDGRGAYQVTGIGTGEAERRLVDVAGSVSESYIDYTFYAESGTAVKEVDLLFSGIGSLGHTNAYDAIVAGDLRVLVREELPDGTINRAVTDLYVSEDNTITAKFAFAAEDGLAANGLSVEVRALDENFDLSMVEVFAIFG